MSHYYNENALCKKVVIWFLCCRKVQIPLKPLRKIKILLPIFCLLNREGWANISSHKEVGGYLASKR